MNASTTTQQLSAKERVALLATEDVPGKMPRLALGELGQTAHGLMCAGLAFPAWTGEERVICLTPDGVAAREALKS